ncbi:hypothetical protein Back11_59010 [Paenibacillus baekrokdamisoli]|uniref:Uncharacterized protein n=1 Tax=Paenibacillus baekrokdamisoli TaxID=1712516 RepID=A0A3G9J1C5_9BACL|nr:S-layer homology domain-containing protein [Paenibacillus baekrokdamisoli]MBB3071410.1 hypothetical protein [Paenibacillus baekrokdamisoli]BBH24556.1 hypothetical protein Back11_59010 [Paenibacillus baekrokdamisoli]
MTVVPLHNPGGGGSGGTNNGDNGNGNNGKGTIAAGDSAIVKLSDRVSVKVPKGATNQQMTVTITQVEDLAGLLPSGLRTASPVYEILKNVPGNFAKPVTISITFDPSKIGSEKPSIYYYDENLKKWIELGGTVQGSTISVEVDHFTKFAVFALDNSVVTEPEPEKVSFTDLQGHWAKGQITKALELGFVQGYSDRTYRPNNNVTRVEFVAMLDRVLKLEGDAPRVAFADSGQIPAWAASSVAKAVEAGLIQGYGDHTFRPDQQISRAEMAVIAARVMKLQIDEEAVLTFIDVLDIPVWAQGGMKAAVSEGLFQGKEGNRLAPNDKATRAEAIVLLMRMLEKKQ